MDNKDKIKDLLDDLCSDYETKIYDLEQEVEQKNNEISELENQIVELKSKEN